MDLGPFRRSAWLAAAAILSTQALLAQGGRTPRAAEVPSALAANQYFTGSPWRGNRGISETVAEIVARDASGPAVAPLQPTIKKPRRVKTDRKVDNPLAPRVSQWPPEPIGRVPDTAVGPRTPQSVGTSWVGTHMSQTAGYVPPDSMGAVGPTQVFVLSNGRFRLYDKAGNLDAIDVTEAAFFQSVRGGVDVSDPHARYDRLSGRWFITAITVAPASNELLIAVSSGPTLTSASSFTFFHFAHDSVGVTPNIDTGGFADYDTLGVDANALYVGVNEFGGGGSSSNFSTSAYVVNKADLLAGLLTVTAFRGLAVGSGAGIYTPQGVDNDDSSAAEGYIVGVDNQSASLLVMRRIINPAGVPAISGNINIAVPATSQPLAQTANGSAIPLDALDDRLFAAAVHKNKITGDSTLWTAHNIAVDAAGVAGSGDRNGSRWYQIANLTTTPTLIQAGTAYDPTATQPKGYWIPSVAMTGQGHMALGFSFAGAADFAGAAVAGRLVTDQPGTTRTASVIVNGAGPYNDFETSVPVQRWGDYSMIAVDPGDDQTLWTFQEYAFASNTTDSWGVRAAKLLAPPPATVAAASPALVYANTPSAVVTIQGVSDSGSAFFDPGVGFAKRISASISGGVTVNSVTFIDETTVRLNISTVGASPGPKNVTIVNPDGQQSVGSGVINLASSTPPADVNGDGHADLIFRNYQTGALEAWFMNGSTRTGAAAMGTVADTSWQLVGMADFDGNNQPDLVWRHRATGDVAVWFMNGTALSSSMILSRPADRNYQLAVVADLDGDAKPDFVWRNAATGENLVWFMDGISFAASAALPTVELRWHLMAGADLNSDHRADLVWRDYGTGENAVWYMAGAGIGSVGSLPAVTDVNWQLAGAVDLDGDGATDLLWHNNATAANVVWYMNGAHITGSAALTTQSDANWSIGLPPIALRPGDFNGDGRPDLVWRNVLSGANSIWYMAAADAAGNAGASATAALPNVTDSSWQLVSSSADFDGDGHVDLLWRNIRTGENAIWEMIDAALRRSDQLTTIADLDWVIAGAGDFNADGKPDIVWRNTRTGENAVWLMNGTSWPGTFDFFPTVSRDWHLATVADIDGDGRPDLIWRNASTGENAVWFMHGAQLVRSSLLPTVAGSDWEIAAARDLNDDGFVDVIWRNAVTGANVIWYMNGSAPIRFGTLPTIADTNWRLIR